MPKVELKLPGNFPAKKRRRAGIEVPTGHSITVDVDKDQLNELKEDGKIIVTEQKEAKPLEKMKKAELLDIVEAEGVEGVDENTKNADLVEAIKENRE